MSAIVNPVTGTPFPGQTVAGGTTVTSTLGSIALCGTLAGAITVNRPASRVQGSIFAVADADGSAGVNPITVSGNGDLIDGVSSVLLTRANELGVFLYDAGQWRRLVGRRIVAGLPCVPLDFTVDNPIGTPTVQSILGSRLVRWLLNYSVGSWVDLISGNNAVQATAGRQPAVANLSKGQSYPLFDGLNDFTQAGPISTLPVWNTTHHAMWGTLARITKTDSWMWDTTETFGVTQAFCYANGAGVGNIAGALFNGVLSDSAWHTVIAVRNGATGVVTNYRDGVAQTATVVSTWSNDWKTSITHKQGIRNDNVSAPLGGGLASMFWAYDVANPFTASDVAALHSAMAATI